MRSSNGAETYIYTVEGLGAFPDDMLRTEEAMPLTPDDAARINVPNWSEPRRVTLRAFRRASRELWRASGWPVVEQEPAS